MGTKVRLAGSDDKARILALIRELLPAVDAERRWDWIYKRNPHGPALTWLAIDEASGETAGVTSFFRRRLWVGGAEVGGALGGDGYVPPRFRRRGIAAAMHKASRRDMDRFGIEVMFGTPMPANVTPLTQAGARTITDTVRLVRPLHGRALKLGRVGGLLAPLLAPRSAHARLEPAAEGDRRIDDLWAEVKDELAIATVRDAAFYGWRFVRSPSQKQKAFVVVAADGAGGRPLAACALERLGNNLRVIDLLAPARNWTRALRAIAAEAQGCDAVEIKLVREDARARGMWKRGFLAREGKPLNLLLPEESRREAIYYDAARWFFTWAEADLDFG